MMRDDFDQVDVDSPIPYRLTARGHRDVAELREIDRMASCEHEWQVDQRVGLVCRKCDAVTLPRKLGSIPSYLGARERK